MPLWSHMERQGLLLSMNCPGFLVCLHLLPLSNQCNESSHSLVLQKPSRTSKRNEHITCLQRCLKIWCAGDLPEFLSEGRALQVRLKNADSPKKDDDAFASLMYHGKVKASLHQLASKDAGSPLHLEEMIYAGSYKKQQVRDVLIDKHPPSMPFYPECLADSDPQPIHPVISDALDARCIRSTALCTDGGAGPSGVDALGWRRLMHLLWFGIRRAVPLHCSNS